MDGDGLGSFLVLPTFYLVLPAVSGACCFAESPASLAAAPLLYVAAHYYSPGVAAVKDMLQDDLEGMEQDAGESRAQPAMDLDENMNSTNGASKGTAGDGALTCGQCGRKFLRR